MIVKWRIDVNGLIICVMDCGLSLSLDGRKFTSLNYLGAQLLAAAGLSLRDYNQYLLDLQDAVPAINAYGYMDSDGKWRSLLESEVDKEYSSMLGDYAALQYYMLFEDK